MANMIDNLPLRKADGSSAFAYFPSASFLLNERVYILRPCQCRENSGAIFVLNQRVQQGTDFQLFLDRCMFLS